MLAWATPYFAQIGIDFEATVRRIFAAEATLQPCKCSGFSNGFGKSRPCGGCKEKADVIKMALPANLRFKFYKTR